MVRFWYTKLYITAISSVTHKLFQTFTVNINSVARFQAKKEAGNLCQIPSNIARQKTKLSFIISEHQIDIVKQTNVKNELTILRTIIMVKSNNKPMEISGMISH